MINAPPPALCPRKRLGTHSTEGRMDLWISMFRFSRLPGLEPQNVHAGHKKYLLKIFFVSPLLDLLLRFVFLLILFLLVLLPLLLIFLFPLLPQSIIIRFLLLFTACSKVCSSKSQALSYIALTRTIMRSGNETYASDCCGDVTLLHWHPLLGSRAMKDSIGLERKFYSYLDFFLWSRNVPRHTYYLVLPPLPSNTLECSWLRRALTSSQIIKR